MNICIIIPAHNEEKYIALCLQSLVNQSYSAKEIIVVNDNSTDQTAQIIERFCQKYSYLKLIHVQSSDTHEPGSKIIKAFYNGFQEISKPYDIICKFDADSVFPKNYLYEVKESFSKNPKLGMYAGFCYVEDEAGNWIKDKLNNNEHIRGSLKAYRKACFEDIGGLQKEMGWDTVDELLARYHGWQTQTDESLQVQHLKPTGKLYAASLPKRFGIALYKMDYHFWLSLITLLKIAFSKKQISFFLKGMTYFLRASLIQKPDKMVNADEGKFIRNFRWKMMRKKFGL